MRSHEGAGNGTGHLDIVLYDSHWKSLLSCFVSCRLPSDASWDTQVQEGFLIEQLIWNRRRAV